jgi:hypothetical protein
VLGILITLLITQSLIIGGHCLSGRLYFKKQIENKLGRKIKFRDIK